ncbi:hypothetical protein HB364_02940 [Pseudoflavitalea sp. X16]|uniref:hypothetical protein n=1 Tax=Paraflavitalea devenefica TaxID=2716334 RepID=UPI00141E673E|nr:hypothetical protein [Paraflavitalea devenefica]NII24021.1 hypothetical protein [Paraflavitalea devenefica]
MRKIALQLSLLVNPHSDNAVSPPLAANNYYQPHPGCSNSSHCLRIQIANVC